MAEQEKKEWMDWQNTKVLQKAVVADEEGNMLVLRRVPEGPAARPDMWDLPGGSVSPQDLEDENPLIAGIKEEIRQETGFEVEEVEPVYVSSWTFTRSPGKILGVAIGYNCKVRGVKPEAVLSPEHYQSKWCSREQLLDMDFGDDGGLHMGVIQNAIGKF